MLTMAAGGDFPQALAEALHGRAEAKRPSGHRTAPNKERGPARSAADVRHGHV